MPSTPKTPCSFEGCINPVRAKSLCVGHWDQLRNGRELTTLLIRARIHPDQCSKDGCLRPYEAKGLCKKHYEAERKSAKKVSYPPCSTPLCSNKAKAARGGTCKSCWQRERRSKVVFPPCSFPGCSNRAGYFGTGRIPPLCSGHDHQRRNGQEPRPLQRVFAATDGMKRCCDCLEVKPTIAFRRNTNQSDGYLSFCKPCLKQRGTAQKADAKRRALKKATAIEDIDYTRVEELSQGVCYLCHLPLVAEAAHRDPLQTTEDHVIPLARGGSHATNNLRFVHARCNMRKNDRLLEELTLPFPSPVPVTV